MRNFDMFHGNQRCNGSGLGIILRQEASEEIDVAISVDAEYDKGTVFHFNLERRINAATA
jgi:light-regulated signal transduction histidine kinase (bacteriophytochrome)